MSITKVMPALWGMLLPVLYNSPIVILAINAKGGAIMANTRNKTSNRGLGSPNMDEKTKHRIQSAGGHNSPQNFAKNRNLAKKAGHEGGSR